MVTAEEKLVWKVLPKPNEYVEISYYFKRDELNELKELRKLHHDGFLKYIPTIPETKSHSGYALTNKGKELRRYLEKKMR